MARKERIEKSHHIYHYLIPTRLVVVHCHHYIKKERNSAQRSSIKINQRGQRKANRREKECCSKNEVLPEGESKESLPWAHSHSTYAQNREDKSVSLRGRVSRSSTYA